MEAAAGAAAELPGLPGAADPGDASPPTARMIRTYSALRGGSSWLPEQSASTEIT